MGSSPEYVVAKGAILSGDTDRLHQLLDQNRSVARERDADNTTLLIHLVDWPGHRPHASLMAQTLLEHGAEVDVRRNSENGTPLTAAMCTNEPDVIDILLNYGADLDAPCGFCPGTAIEFFESMKDKSENEAMLHVIRKYREIAT